jgi:hypothetical protein
MSKSNYMKQENIKNFMHNIGCSRRVQNKFMSTSLKHRLENLPCSPPLPGISLKINTDNHRCNTLSRAKTASEARMLPLTTKQLLQRWRTRRRSRRDADAGGNIATTSIRRGAGARMFLSKPPARCGLGKVMTTPRKRPAMHRRIANAPRWRTKERMRSPNANLSPSHKGCPAAEPPPWIYKETLLLGGFGQDCGEWRRMPLSLSDRIDPRCNDAAWWDLRGREVPLHEGRSIEIGRSRHLTSV